MNVCGPTGNFGNIFAAYIAKLMGLPINKLICASNVNNILTDFLETGTYDRNRTFNVTMSPSMDILISSNLERLLYFVAGSEKTAAYMNELNTKGVYTVGDDEIKKIKENFIGCYASEEETAECIKSDLDKYGYLHDTHTAVAFKAAYKYIEASGDTSPMVIDSTASPYKFAADVYKSLTGKEPTDPLSALDELSSLTGTEIPYPLAGIATRKINFNKTVKSEEMLSAVLEYVNQ